jgi:hypothetical protein
MKNFLGDFIARVCREDIFKRTTENESLYEIINCNGITVINFAISKKSDCQKYKVLTS